MIRNHKIFKIEYHKKRLGNNPEDLFKFCTIVAPNEKMAKAWVESKDGFVKILSINESPLDGFIQEHIW